MILLSLPFADWPSLPPLARDGWELATWIIIGLVVIVLGLYRKDLRAVLHQVKNSHQTNLRDDMDGVGDRLDDVLDRLEEFGRDLRGIRSDVGGLRGELREERKDRCHMTWKPCPDSASRYESSSARAGLLSITLATATAATVAATFALFMRRRLQANGATGWRSRR